ncbi:hypothetical protein GAO09_28650 [Rhizobiales bacterium RZME27]|uniref:DUF7677 domain-containing protein n=2 Tax=Endobacterium cereale TaxID=2663029 RepID=A0A6A8AF83_9HYPH|nr:hypothetical protein [Endobacterium cereale]
MHPDLRIAIAQFSLWVANGSVGHPILENVDYSEVLQEPSAMERLYFIFTNCLELDEEGAPTNARHAEERAAQWLRQYCERDHVIDPPLSDEEYNGHMY